MYAYSNFNVTKNNINFLFKKFYKLVFNCQHIEHLIHYLQKEYCLFVDIFCKAKHVAYTIIEVLIFMNNQ